MDVTTSSDIEPTEQGYLQDGVAALERGDAATARVAACRVLAESPVMPEALRLLATAVGGDLTRSSEDQIAEMALPPAAWFGLGLQFAEAGQFEAAVAAFEQVARGQPDWADAWYNLAESHRRLGAAVEAVTALERTLKIDPDHPEAWYNLGNLLAARGDLPDAVVAYNRFLELRDGHAAGYNNRGVVFRRLGDVAAAATDFRRAIECDPGFPAAFDNLGNALVDLDQPEAAISAFEAAIHLVPDYHDAHYNLGNVHRDAGRADLAIDCYTRTLDLQPDHEDARTHLGILLQDLGRLDAAEAAFRPLLEIQADHPQNHGNLANVLRDQGRYYEALAQFDAALEGGETPQLLGNRALTLQHAGRLEEAISEYRRALQQAPDDVILNNNMSQALLLDGRFQEGWQVFEHRLNDPELADLSAGISARRWRGENLKGISILLRCEQGLGDAIQFVRFAENLAQLGAEVVVACPRRMMRLFSSLSSVAGVVENAIPYPDSDYWSPLLSLPGQLGLPIDELGKSVPYLSPEAGLVDQWSARLGPGIRIGLAWQGNPAYVGDHARSIPLEYLWPLTARQGVSFYALQQADPEGQLEVLNVDGRVIDLGPTLDEADAFIDTAAVLSQLDLLITSDTSLPHLAGALGCPVWMALPYAPDWRWMLARSDSPWYPTMRLARQPQPWDWQAVVAQLDRALGKWLDTDGAPNDTFDAILGDGAD